VKLQKELGLTYFFITHDLGMVRHIADRVAVMYLGKLMELADTATLFSNARHPYTKALLASIPIPDPDLEAARPKTLLQGDIPSPAAPPSGCRFRTRCPIAEDRCAREVPAWREIAPGHMTACHLV
jgi:oligopeptide/dipeptide ABC transporter ATP-binding protein